MEWGWRFPGSGSAWCDLVRVEQSDLRCGRPPSAVAAAAMSPLDSYRRTSARRTVWNIGARTWKACASDSNRDSNASRAGPRHPGPIRTSPASGGRLRTRPDALPGSTDQKVAHQSTEDNGSEGPLVRSFLYSFKRRLRRLAARLLAALPAAPPLSGLSLRPIAPCRHAPQPRRRRSRFVCMF